MGSHWRCVVRHADQSHFPIIFDEYEWLAKSILETVGLVVGEVVGTGIAHQLHVKIARDVFWMSFLFNQVSFMSVEPFQCTKTLSPLRFTIFSIRNRWSSSTVILCVKHAFDLSAVNLVHFIGRHFSHTVCYCPPAIPLRKKRSFH